MKTLMNKMVKNRRQSRRLLEERKLHKMVILRPNKIWDATMDFLTDKISYQEYRKILWSEHEKMLKKEKLNGNTENQKSND